MPLAESKPDVARRYLLGRLPVDERDQVIRRIVEDPRFCLLVREAETDLVDDYVRSRLNREDRVCFEERLLGNPDLAERVRTAHSLARFLAPPVRTVRPSRIRAVSRYYLLAAGIILSILGMHWYLSPETPQPSIVVLEVPAGVPRSSDRPLRFQMPPSGDVQLRLEVRDPHTHRFRVRLTSLEHGLLRDVPDLEPDDSDGARFVAIEVPAALLRRGSYELSLQKMGTPEESPLEFYYFQVP